MNCFKKIYDMARSGHLIKYRKDFPFFYVPVRSQNDLL